MKKADQLTEETTTGYVRQYLLHSLKAFESLAKAFGVELCPECAKHYEPAASAMFEYVKFPIAHISLVRFRITDSPIVEVKYEVIRCCESTDRLKQSPRRETLIDLTREPFGDFYFIEQLLQRYPKLQNKPITLRTLQEAGCNIEAERAMWQLAKGGDEEQ